MYHERRMCNPKIIHAKIILHVLVVTSNPEANSSREDEFLSARRHLQPQDSSCEDKFLSARCHLQPQDSSRKDKFLSARRHLQPQDSSHEDIFLSAHRLLQPQDNLWRLVATHNLKIVFGGSSPPATSSQRITAGSREHKSLVARRHPQPQDSLCLLIATCNLKLHPALDRCIRIVKCHSMSRAWLSVHAKMDFYVLIVTCNPKIDYTIRMSTV
ncbi:hypothetical protein HHX47_DHR9000147 [Lentinula edodes]|nr:hypothetical protein HHX47_DHR9000147 [Lentinula edodes]